MYQKDRWHVVSGRRSAGETGNPSLGLEAILLEGGGRGGENGNQVRYSAGMIWSVSMFCIQQGDILRQSHQEEPFME
jgi:hypothetical protein